MSRNSWPGMCGMSTIQYRLQTNARIGGKTSIKSNRRSDNQLCSYIHRICLQNRLEGFDYCIRHILEDRSAPFRQCSYVHPQSGKRCPNAARRTDRRDSTLCPWHIKKLYLKKKQAQINHIRLVSEESGKKDDAKNLLRDLEHYCPNKTHDNSRTNIDWIQQEDASITASDHLRKKISESAANLTANCSDDEFANSSIDDVFRSDAMESDSESVDSDHEDPLKHAGVYTAEEVSLVLRDKMLRLQSLYIDQFRHLQYLLREKRKKYLIGLKKDKETPGILSVSETASQPNFHEKGDYDVLKSLWRYHRLRGPEALLKRQANCKRKAAMEGSVGNNQSSLPVCIFAKPDVVCTNKCVPLSNYCREHILYDVHQVLYRPCAASSPSCLTPVVSYMYKNTCIYHKELNIDKTEDFKISDQTEDDCDQIGSLSTEPELFETMNDIASLGFDAVAPGSLFGLDQFEDIGSTELLQ